MRKLLVLPLLMSSSFASSAQDKHSGAIDTMCRCRIVLRHVVTLGHEADTIALLQQSTVARDSRGQFYVAPVLPYGAVAIYDSAGRFKSMVGRRGAGPGELGRIRDVAVIPGDSLVAYDQNRLVMFAPDGKHVRTSIITSGSRGFYFAALDNGVLIINNYSPTQPAFYLVDPDFKGGRKFGRSVGGDRFGSDELLFHIAGIGDGQFVAVQQNHRFGMQVWDTTGRMVREYTRQPDWFPAWTRADRVRIGFGTLPSVLGVHYEPSRERVWIVATVADPKWKPQAPPNAPTGSEGGGFPPVPVAAFDRARDTVIELLDVRSGRVLLSQRFNASVPYIRETGLLSAHRELPGGLLVIDIYRPEILFNR